MSRIRQTSRRFPVADQTDRKIISEELAVLFETFITRSNPYRVPWVPVKLTRRQRIRVELAMLRWRIHDALFPECR